MRRLILLALPCVFLLTGCGDREYSCNSCRDGSCAVSSNYSNSDSGTTYYRSADRDAYNTSARSSAPFGNYPVNPNATCKTVG